MAAEAGPEHRQQHVRELRDQLRDWTELSVELEKTPLNGPAARSAIHKILTSSIDGTRQACFALQQAVPSEGGLPPVAELKNLVSRVRRELHTALGPANTYLAPRPHAAICFGTALNPEGRWCGNHIIPKGKRGAQYFKLLCDDCFKKAFVIPVDRLCVPSNEENPGTIRNWDGTVQNPVPHLQIRGRRKEVAAVALATTATGEQPQRPLTWKPWEDDDHASLRCEGGNKCFVIALSKKGIQTLVLLHAGEVGTMAPDFRAPGGREKVVSIRNSVRERAPEMDLELLLGPDPPEWLDLPDRRQGEPGPSISTATPGAPSPQQLTPGADEHSPEQEDPSIKQDQVDAVFSDPSWQGGEHAPSLEGAGPSAPLEHMIGS